MGSLSVSSSDPVPFPISQDDYTSTPSTAKGMQLPYDILGALPFFSATLGDLCAWTRVDRYLNGVATALLYDGVVLDAGRMDVICKRYPSHVSNTSSGYFVKAGFRSLPDIHRFLLPLETLSRRADLAQRVRYFVCDLPSLCGPGHPDLLDHLAQLLELCPALRAFGWRCAVRNTDRVMRCLPLLRQLEEVEVRKPSCPLVVGPGAWAGGGGGRRMEKWAWEYLESWTSLGTVPSLHNLRHIHLCSPQPHTSALWFCYLLTLAAPAPLESLFLSLPALDADPLSTDAVLLFAQQHARTLRRFAAGPARMGVRALAGLVGVCAGLERVQCAGVGGEEGEEEASVGGNGSASASTRDILWALGCAGAALQLVIIKEEYWQRGPAGAGWAVVPPDYALFDDFREATRLPLFERCRPSWAREAQAA